MAYVIETPPPTPVEAVTEILHGVEIADPYRWLEDQSSPRTRQWIDDQTAYTRAYLSGIRERRRIRDRVEELLAVETVSEPCEVGRRYFFLKRAPRQEQAAIMMRNSDSAEDTILIDPAQRGEGTSTAVSILAISPDGSLLAYSVRHGGEDCSSIEIFDVEKLRVLPDRLPVGFLGGLSFSPAARGFYYVHRALASGRPHFHAVYWHVLGKSFDTDAEIFSLGEDPEQSLAIAGAAGGTLIYLATTLKDPVRTDLYIHEPANGLPPRKVVEQVEGIFFPFLVASRLFALTDLHAPNRRIVAIDLEQPDPDNWHTIVPESKASIQQVTVAGDLICLGYVEDLAANIRVFDTQGGSRGTLPSPSHGTAQLCPPPTETDTAFYRYTSFDCPPTIFRYQPKSGAHEIWANATVPFDSSSLKVARVTYASKDGTSIPMFLVSKKEAHETCPCPTFLTAYGGFGASVTPQFAAYATFLVEHGCRFAVANIRGGSEFGEAWHKAAQRQKRQTSIDDFIAASEWLISQSLTFPGRLAIGGGSNAGLLVAAAFTQRPDLFRAVLCLGPILDMLRYHLFDFASYWIDEFGCADDPDDFAALHAYSPYHQIKDAISYPAVMLISGDADTRCNPLHARKMAARLQAATSSDRPVLLDYRSQWGHSSAQPLSTRIEALTDRLAFLSTELGLSV